MQNDIPLFLMAVVNILGILSFLLTFRFTYKWIKTKNIPKSMAPLYESQAWVFFCIFYTCLILSYISHNGGT